MRGPRGWREWALCVAVVASLYAMVAATAFRFRHPWMTETELMLHMRDAMMWRDLDRP